MSINQNESNELGREYQPEGLPIPADDRETWFADLLDLRVLIFLASVVVVAMTVTVLSLSGNPDQAEFRNSKDVDSTNKTPASKAANVLANRSPVSVAQKTEGRAQEMSSKPLVAQASDGSFELPIRSARVSNCEALSTGITNWKSGGWAHWQLAIQDRRTGYFRCYVTYVAKFESQFGVQLGDRNPLKFTVYPHQSDFTEELIVRLDTPAEPSLRLIANKIESVSGVNVKKVRLVPR